MANLYIAFVLHFNQPINQDREVLREISHDCYRPMFSLFNDDDWDPNLPCPKFSVSITDSLLGLLRD